MPQTLRTFIAFALPEAVVSAMRTLQAELMVRRFPVRWVLPENVHLTLKFLGEVQPQAVERIAAALQKAVAGHAPVTLAVRAIGVFPGISRARVIWAGLDGQVEALNRLQRAVDERLQAIGYAGESRPFRGHLTLGRVRGKINPKQLADALATFETYASAPFTVDTLILFKSDRQPSGAVYAQLDQAPLIFRDTTTCSWSAGMRHAVLTGKQRRRA